ncbi:hypothetical protein PPERSA_11537 [Pseudocohnilembus persalinus]|uniref:TerD domain-containing protein n=1 Tax=Pseudocohnilembus persalinus TaxID=266149 RepID=A0A0V0QWZ9_PSEPJ|nr:hypothetical protein PPERSA_11537 [Pseudocohnilembus persalinus]|eukprot:KRX06892.1 hypothetical protein PPERSA_11537 [Pseudocohnilembus persalinus]
MKKLIKMNNQDKEKMSDYFYFYKKKHQNVFKSSDLLTLGFIFNDNKNEYEAKCTSLNDLREIHTSCTLKFKHSENKEMIHLGGKQNGIYNQEILIDFSKIPLYCSILAVTINCPNGVQNIKKGLMHISDNQQISEQIVIKGIIGNVQSYLVCYFRRQEDQTWKVVPASKGQEQNNDNKVILDNLNLSGYDFGPIKESLNWSEKSGKSYQISNNEVVAIPSKAYEKITLGLGWDTQLDLDSAILMLDKNGKLVDNVYFQNLESKDKSVIHQGDQQEGGDDGDDEKIDIYLNKISPDIHSLWIFLCIYQQGKQFDDVDGAYGRFLVGETEFCKYNMSQFRDPEANGCIMCNIFRVKKKWILRGRGYFTKKTYTSEDVIPIIQEVMDNNFENVKIYTQDQAVEEEKSEDDNENELQENNINSKDLNFDNRQSIKIQFKWSVISKLTALNSHAILLNEEGDKLDAVNMRQMTTENNSLTHSGKMKDKDYDQEITINFSQVPQEVFTIAVLVTGLRPINEITKDAKLQIIFQGSVVNYSSFTNNATGKTYLAMFLTRQDISNTFKCYQCQTAFKDSNIRKILKDNMRLSGKKAKVNMEALNWNIESGKVYKLDQDMTIPIPKLIADDLVIGFGWDCSFDLDSSVILMDINGFIIDNVWWNNTETNGIKHLGDNRTGERDGDDEQIQINLNKINENAKQIWLFISIYNEGVNFIDVNGEYFRIMVHGKEFARMDLGEIDGQDINGCILAQFYQGDKGQWFIKGKGYYTQQTPTSIEVEPIIKSISQGDLKQVKLFNNCIGDGKKPKKLIKYKFDEKIKLKITLDLSKQKMEQFENPKFQLLVRYMGQFGQQISTDHLIDIKKVEYPNFVQQVQNQTQANEKNLTQNQKVAVININFEQIPTEAYMLGFVLASEGLNYTAVGGAYQIFIEDEEVFYQELHLPLDKLEYNSILLFFMNLDIQQHWQLTKICMSDAQFIDNQDKLIQTHIIKTGLDNQSINISRNWNPDQGISFNMRKGDHLIIPSSGYGGMQLGMGWMTDLDLDCFVVMYDKDYEVYDCVYYDNLKSKDTAILHLGDSKQGDTGEDSEVLSVILKNVDEKVQSILLYVHIFSSVQKQYARIVIGGEEFCRYELVQANDGLSDGVIVGEIYRLNPSVWGFQASGLYTEEIHSKEDICSMLNWYKQHDFSKTRVFNPKHDILLPRIQKSDIHKQSVSNIINRWKQEEDEVLTIGFNWILFLKINLKIEVYALDKDAQIIKKIDKESDELQGVKHTGQIKSGPYKVEIDINFSKIDEQVQSLAIMVWSPQILNDYFKSGQMVFKYQGKICNTIEMTNPTQQGMLTTFLSRDDFNTGYWTKCGTVKGFPKEITDQICIDKYKELMIPKRIEHKIKKFHIQSIINIGCCWNYAQDIKIDANVYLINDLGIIHDQLEKEEDQEFDKDQQTYDNLFKINFQKIPDYINVLTLIINSNKPVKGNLQSGFVHVIKDGKVQFAIGLEGIQENGVLILFLTKVGRQWEIMKDLKDFKNKEPQQLMDEYFHLTEFEGVDSEKIQQAFNWKQNNPISLPIISEQVLPIPEIALEGDLSIGLGWDSKIDIDASLLMLDKVGNVYDNIFHQNRQSRDKSIYHHGDNSGTGSNTDDETIDVILNKVDDSVVSLWVFISIFSENKTFDNVKGAYVRILIKGAEFSRYQVTEANDGEQNGCLVCLISRKSGFWTIRGKGYYTKNTPTSEAVIPIMAKVFRGDHSMVTKFQDQQSLKKITTKEITSQQYNQPLNIGFSIKGSKQINGQAYLLNDIGQIIDYVELYKTNSKCQGMQHLGENNDDKREYNQIITIDFNKINPMARYICITVDNKFDNLSKLLDIGSKVDLVFGNQVYKSYKLKDENDKAIQVVYLKRGIKDQMWNVVTYTRKFFTAPTSRKAIEDSIFIPGVNPKGIDYALNWVPNESKSIKLNSDQIVLIPEIGQQSLVLATGWETNIKLDVDASVLILDKDGNLLDNVFYNNLKSKDWAVIHKGDQINKEQGNLDLEQIEIKIDKLNPQVDSIWLFLSIYSKGKLFDEIKTSFVRLMIKNQEFCRYEDQHVKDEVSNGQLLCQIYQYKTTNGYRWCMRSRGFLTQNTSNSLDVIPIMKKISQGDLTNIILPED